MTNELVQRTLNWENLTQAYLDLARLFDEGSKTARYAGLDGISLADVDFHAPDVIRGAQQDLQTNSPITPARLVTIPKRDGSVRKVYILTIRDRIRARALFRVLEPLCEGSYSPYLFSYRRSHPSSYAARSVARRYHRYYGRDCVLTLDLKNYSDHLDHAILKTHLRRIGTPPEFMELLEPFFAIPLQHPTGTAVSPIGIPQGTPLTALFANIYLHEVDEAIGPSVSLYRRVGDDLIACDTDEPTIQAARIKAQQLLKNLKLIIQSNKTHCAKSNEPFKFLGYYFAQNRVRLNDAFVRELEVNWKKTLRGASHSLTHRLKRLHTLAYNTPTSFHYQFLELLKQHPHIDDDEQVKKLSAQFYRLATRYLMAVATPRNRRLAHESLSRLPLPSLYDYYLTYRRGRFYRAPAAIPKTARH